MVEILISAAFFVISIVFYTQTGKLPDSKFDVLGPAAFPKIILGLLCLLSLILTVSNIRKYQNSDKQKIDWKVFLTEYKMVLTLILIFLVYVLSIKTFGFLLCNFVFLAASQWFLSPRKIKNIPIIFTISLSLTFGAFYFFTNYLNIIFPPGRIFG